jgi:flagellar hook-associated protein 3 FlgL
MSNLDNALDNILTIRAEVGSRLKEVDAVQNTREDLTIQYQAAISNLQDVDYAKVISDLTLQQMHLQAAQKSFASTQSLTLFNYIS